MDIDSSDIENLEVYQLASNISDTLWELVNSWTQFEKHSLGSELVTTSDSIAASIAEGFSKESYQDNIRCIYSAIGSFNKVEYWIKVSHKRKLISDITVQQIDPLMDELARRLNTYLNSIGKHRQEQTSNYKLLTRNKTYANI